MPPRAFRPQRLPHAMARTYHVYIMSNRHRTVLYIGVTGDLAHRVHAH